MWNTSDGSARKSAAAPMSSGVPQRRAGVRLVVDRMSLPYLVGSEIDWVESLMGGGFTVHNPNAVSTCGCGHSFRTKDQEGTPRTCGH